MTQSWARADRMRDPSCLLASISPMQGMNVSCFKWGNDFTGSVGDLVIRSMQLAAGLPNAVPPSAAGSLSEARE